LANILLVGYGNLDREDDGVAWHILSHLAEKRGAVVRDLDTFDEAPGDADGLHLLYTLQLTPELAEVVAGYDAVCFIDAHTGSYAEDVRVAHLEAGFQTSPFTHHMTPETCLALAKSLYGESPKAIVVSVRGYRFGFSRQLSQETAALALEAARRISAWLEAEKIA
jgi:hydrogenase maturation protease